MKKQQLVLLLGLFLFSSLALSQNRGELMADSLLISFNKQDIEAIYEDFELPEFLFTIEYESIELHKLIYWTIDARGEQLVVASGLIAIPVGTDCALPLLNFNHGTLNYDQTLSDLRAGAMQHFVGVPFAANGYICVLPDYLGYGETPKTIPHAFLHAKSEATAVVDMLRAAREFCAVKNIPVNDQLFLLGYSHGGHVTMAVHRELEEFHLGEFEVTASAPASGAYDVSGVMRDSMLYSEQYSNAFYIAFSTLSFQYTYRNIYDSLSEVFVPPYDSIIPLIFDRNQPQTFWIDMLPQPGYEIWQPQFLAGVRSDSLHPLNVALRANDVYDWIPLAPMRMYYCANDDVIPSLNTQVAHQHMLALGAEQILALEVGDNLNHLECSFPAVVAAKIWFDAYREPCLPSAAYTTGPDLEDAYFFPNPFTEMLQIELPGFRQGEVLNLTIYDVLGRTVYRSTSADLTERISLPLGQLLAGTYILQLSRGAYSKNAVIVKAR